MLAEASATKNLEASVKVAMRVLSFVIGLAAVALAAVDVVRTINPSLLTGHSGFFGLVFNFYPVVPALVTGLVGFAFSFVLKILSRGSRRSKLTSWALVLSLIGVLLSGASYATTHIFPEGMIHPVNTSSAPLNDSDELTERMNWAFNPCDSGWAVIDPARFPGVSYINVCASTSVLFVAYDSREQARAYDGIMSGRAADYIETSLGEPFDEANFASLSGDQWLVVGPKTGIKRLHSIWGGDVEPVAPAEPGVGN